MLLCYLCGFFQLRHICHTWRLHGACVCHKPCRLLSGSIGWRSEEGYRQAATCPQCSRLSRVKQQQVRPWTQPISSDMFYTGSTLLTGSDSDCVSRCSNVTTAWLLDTWPSSADLSPASTDTGIYDLLAVTFHELDCQHTEDVRSVMLDHLLGTLFLSVSRIMHCLCLTLGTSSDISTSCPTSTLTAFTVFCS